MASSGGVRNCQWIEFRFEAPRRRRCGEGMFPSPLRRGLAEVAIPLFRICLFLKWLILVKFKWFQWLISEWQEWLNLWWLLHEWTVIMQSRLMKACIIQANLHGEKYFVSKVMEGVLIPTNLLLTTPLTARVTFEISKNHNTLKGSGYPSIVWFVLFRRGKKWCAFDPWQKKSWLRHSLNGQR